MIANEYGFTVFRSVIRGLAPRTHLWIIVYVCRGRHSFCLGVWAVVGLNKPMIRMYAHAFLCILIFSSGIMGNVEYL